MRVSYTCHINGIGVCMAKGPPRHPPPNRLPLKPPELSCICAFIAAAGLPPQPLMCSCTCSTHLTMTKLTQAHLILTSPCCNQQPRAHARPTE